MLEQECGAIKNIGAALDDNEASASMVANSTPALWPNILVRQLFLDIRQSFKDDEDQIRNITESEKTFYRISLRYLLQVKQFRMGLIAINSTEMVDGFGSMLDALEHLIFESKGRRKPTQPLKIAIIAASIFFLIEQSLNDSDYLLMDDSIHTRFVPGTPKNEAVLTVCSLFGLEYGSVLESPAFLGQERADFRPGTCVKLPVIGSSLTYASIAR